MDIRRLEYFCAIIDKGQISKAARSLHISQSPLSQRLKELEEELGVTLIHRAGRAWQVTPEGWMLYRRAQHILTFMSSLRDEVRGASDRLHGLVRIGTGAFSSIRPAASAPPPWKPRLRPRRRMRKQR